tara:strand:- start:37 stop:393 length:357 start_codon:yes stop_codon:yes gene_type:complete
MTVGDMSQKLKTVRPSKLWFSFCVVSALTSAIFFAGNIFVWGGDIPAPKHFFGALMGNIVGLLFLIRFEFIDYGRRNSGTYADWKPKARIRARWVTLLGWLLGFIHTFYFVQEWSRNW